MQLQQIANAVAVVLSTETDPLVQAKMKAASALTLQLCLGIKGEVFLCIVDDELKAMTPQETSHIQSRFIKP